MIIIFEIIILSKQVIIFEINLYSFIFKIIFKVHDWILNLNAKKKKRLPRNQNCNGRRIQIKQCKHTRQSLLSVGSPHIVLSGELDETQEADCTDGTRGGFSFRALRCCPECWDQGVTAKCQECPSALVVPLHQSLWRRASETLNGQLLECGGIPWLMFCAGLTGLWPRRCYCLFSY